MNIITYRSNDIYLFVLIVFCEIVFNKNGDKIDGSGNKEDLDTKILPRLLHFLPHEQQK